MWPDDLAAMTPLARHTRLYDLEDPVNYLHRLLADNGISTDVSKAQLNRWRLNGNNQRAVALTAIAERLSDRPRGFFGKLHQHAQPLPDIHYPDRWACTRCTSGRSIPQIPHLHHEICLRHERWIGPGTDPDSQFQLDADTPGLIRTARHLSHAIGTGKTTPLAVTRAWEMLRDDAYLSGDSNWSDRLLRVKNNRKARPGIHDRAALYPETASLALLLSDPKFLTRTLAPQLTDAEVRGLFRNAWPSAASVLVERVMLYLRPLRARASTFETEQAWATPQWGHEPDLTTVDTAGWSPHHPFVITGRASARHLFLSETVPHAIARRPEILDVLHWPSRPAVELWGKSGALTTEATFQCELGHTWVAPIKRVMAGHNCGVCAGSHLVTGVNDFASRHPHLVPEWDDTLNGDLTPSRVAPHTMQKVFWRCPRGHSYRSSVSQRVRGRNCAVCAGKQVQQGVNDLASRRPHVAARWDHERNHLSPDAVTHTSSRLAHWICERGHRWKRKVSEEAKCKGCYICTSQAAEPGVNDLTTTHPEIATLWDSAANGRTATTVTANTAGTFTWGCPAGHRYRCEIKTHVRRSGCPVCTKRTVVAGYNDLVTTHPDAAKQWHDSNTKHPSQVTSRSLTAITWACPRGHSYRRKVREQVADPTCPRCPAPSERLPDQLLTEWDWTANTLDPLTLTITSREKVHWICHQGHKWHCAIRTRAVDDSGQCPKCHRKTRARPTVGVNDLPTTHPHLVTEWDRDTNTHGPEQYRAGSQERVGWKCAAGHRWIAQISVRVRGTGCGYCSGRHAIPGVNDLATTHPTLANEWDRSNTKSPATFKPGSKKIVTWNCGNCCHVWSESIVSRTRDHHRCPACHPEDRATEKYTRRAKALP